jgi:aspartate racemase
MSENKKIVGILGGMGPYATIDFMQLVLELTPAKSEKDHIHTIVDSNPAMPSRTRAYLFNEEDPSPYMLQGIKNLINAGADFVVVPCNSAHYFLPGIRQQYDFPYINMIDVTAQSILESGYKAVGLMAGEVTVGAGLYEAACGNRTSILQVGNAEQAQIRQIIEAVKIGAIDDQTRAIYFKLTEQLKAQGAEAVVLGCTELQAVADSGVKGLPVIDSLHVLAKQTIQRALT